MTAEKNQQQDTLVRSAGKASGAVFLSRISGLVREMTMAHFFGASMANDAFTIGFRIPNLTRDLFAEGALSSAFVPVFTRELKADHHAEAFRLANLVATGLILIVGALCVAGAVLAHWLVDWFAQGVHNTPGKYQLTVTLTRIMFPFLLVVALAAQAMGVLNALGNFGVPALSSTFFNIGSVAMGLFLGKFAGPTLGVSTIEGMAWGVVFGGVLQLGWQMPTLYRAGFRFRPELDFSHPRVREIIRMMGPAILGNAAVQINVMVNTSFASEIVDPVRNLNGPVSWLGYAFRFMQLPLGLFGVAIATATLPAISRSAASGKLDEFRQTLSSSVGLVFLLTIPSSIGLALLGPAMIGAIYQTANGEFDAYDTQQAGVALSCFAIGLAGYSALKVLTPAFYALGDSRTPMLISLASVAINYFAVSTLIGPAGLGHAGLALSTSFVALFGFLTQFWLLRRKAGGMYGRNLLSSTMQIITAAFVMGMAVWCSTQLMQRWLGTSKLGHIADLAVSIPLGAAIYYVTCRLLGVAELSMATSALPGPLRRMLHSRIANAG